METAETLFLNQGTHRARTRKILAILQVRVLSFTPYFPSKALPFSRTFFKSEIRYRKLHIPQRMAEIYTLKFRKGLISEFLFGFQHSENEIFTGYIRIMQNKYTINPHKLCLSFSAPPRLCERQIPGAGL